MSLTIDDIGDAALLANEAYRLDAKTDLSRLGWQYVNPAALGVKSSFIDSSGYFTANFGNTLTVADVNALLAFNSSTKTLSIAFRGTDGLQDLVNDIVSDFGILYSRFAADLIDPILLNASKFGATRILVTGHSLGGALVEELLGHNSDPRLVGVTFGSPGATDIENAPGSDTRLINIGHVDLYSTIHSSSQGDAVFRVKSSTHVQGSDIRVDLPDQPDYSLPETAERFVLGEDYGQHKLARYLETAKAIREELDQNAADNNPINVRTYSYVIGDGNLAGSSDPNVIIGGSGPDSLRGLDGNDILDGGPSRDTLSGGSGNDVIYGGDGDDTAVFDLSSTSYNISLRGSTVTVAVKFSDMWEGTDTLHNVEFLKFYDKTIPVLNNPTLIDLSAGTSAGGKPSDGRVTASNSGASGNEGTASGVSTGATIVGNDTSEYLTGTSGPDVIRGMGGNDVLTGYGGQDTLDGGLGSDTADYSYEPASVSGTVDLAAGTAFFPGFYTEQLTSIENIWMGTGNDQVYGDSGPNDLRGGPGNDILRGGLGNDVVYGDWKYSDQGGTDTAILSYTYGSGYAVSGSANALHIVGAEGDDWYYNIENFQFASGVAKTAAEVLQGRTFTPGVQTIERISVASNGTQGNLYTYYVSISADGRFVAFESDSSNLVAGDTFGSRDIFIYDRITHSTELASVATHSVQPAGGSVPSISGDGRYVAFSARGSDYIPGTTNTWYQAFVHDRINQTTECVSVTNDGVLSGGASAATISADGRYVVFWSNDNLDFAHPGGGMFVRDRTTGTTERIGSGLFASYSNTRTISDDGRYVVGVDNSGQITVFDRQIRTTEIVSVASDGTPGNRNNLDQSSWWPSISADGRYVAFESYATNLVSGDTNGKVDIFVYDRIAHSTQRVSIGTNGIQANGDSALPSISADGRFVVFQSFASNLVLGDTNFAADSFIYDRATGTTERLSIANNGTQGNQTSGGFSSVSGDGRYVAFNSNAKNLVTGDTNGVTDGFVVDRAPNGAPTAAADAVTTAEDSPLAGNVLLANGDGADSDPDGDSLTVVAVNNLTANIGHSITLASGALLAINPDGRFVYDPNGRFAGLNVGQTASDSFTYTISDSQGHTSTATVSLTITGTLHGLMIKDGSGTLNGTAADDQIAGGSGNETIRGGTGNDWLQGGVGADNLYGDDGNDILDGGDGNDFIDGGTGFNAAVYAGPRSSYQVIRDSGGVRVFGPEGSDTLTSIGQLSFSDGTVLVSSLPTTMGIISIAATGADKPEGNTGTTPFTFTVTLDQAPTSSQTVSWAVTGSGTIQASSSDFLGSVLPSGTLAFAAGETFKIVTVNVLGDTTVEPTEGFTVTLSNPSAGLQLSTSIATGMIQNDDGSTASIAASSASKPEGNTGTTPFTFTVTLDQAPTSSQTVSWAVTGSGTIQASSSDFLGSVLPSGTLTFATGEASKTIAVNVLGDTAVELDEGFTVTLSNPSAGLQLSTSIATGMIQNDDSFIFGGPGNDILSGRAGDDIVDGGPGINALVYSSAASHYTVTVVVGASGIIVRDKVGTDGTDVIFNVQKLQFSDQPLDVTTFTQAATLPAAQFTSLAELYIATFNRAPDAIGLDYWASQLKNGMPLPQIAASFFVQPETLAAYPAGQPTTAFVNAVYQNVLGRQSDVAGLNYWVSELENGHVGKDTFLLAIINGALAQSGSADAQYLTNKATVGLHYALTQGLSDANWAKTVMSGVTSSTASVTTATNLTDGFAATAASASGSELVVQVLGIVP